MDDAHLKAYGLLAEAIFKDAYAMAKSDDKWSRTDPIYHIAPWPLYYNYSMSTFEAVSVALTKLDILRPVNDN